MRSRAASACRACCWLTATARSRPARRWTSNNRARSIAFVRLEGTDDVSRVAGCAVCVVADRFSRPAAEWQGEEGLAMLTRLASYAGDAPIVFAGALQDGLLHALAREGHVRRERLAGSSPEALIAAMRAMVAMEANCSPSEVDLTALGTPPSGFVVPWSEASIGGYSLERVLSQVQLTRIEARASRLWLPGPFALGLAAARHRGHGSPLAASAC